MVKAGDPTDAMVEAIAEHLEPGNGLVDGGDAHFEDIRRREDALRERGVHFVGAGVSGGEDRRARGGPGLARRLQPSGPGCSSASGRRTPTATWSRCSPPPTWQPTWRPAQDGWRRVVVTTTTLGVPVLGMSAALAYYDTVRRERLPAALVQGLRDYFGAHTYQRSDRGGTFHRSADRSEQRAANSEQQSS